MKTHPVDLAMAPGEPVMAPQSSFPRMASWVSQTRLWITRLLHATSASASTLDPSSTEPDEGTHQQAEGPVPPSPCHTAPPLAFSRQLMDCPPNARLTVTDVANARALKALDHGSLTPAEPVIMVSGEWQTPMTLTDVVNLYIDKLKAAGKKKTALDYASLFQRRVIDPFPNLATCCVSDISPIHITQLLKATLNGQRSSRNRSASVAHLSPQEAQAQPMRREAAKLRSMLLTAFRTVMNVHLDPNVPDVDPGTAPPYLPFNPVQPVRTIQGAICARRRILSADELAALVIRLSTIQTPAARVILLAIYLGGQRFAQVMRAMVSDYSPRACTLMLFDSKGRRASARPHLLPVSGRAAELLDELAQRAKTLMPRRTRSSGTLKPSPWVFSSFGSRPLDAQTVSDLLAAVKAELIEQGYIRADFDARDLRRTIETYLSEQGVSKEARGHLQSHGIGGVQDTHYDLYAHFEEKVQALRQVHSWLEHAMNDFLRRHDDRIEVGVPRALTAKRLSA